MIKLPKSINICGVEHRVLTDKKSGGGHFDSEKAIIIVGTRCKHDVLMIFLHEVIEATIAMRALRWRMYSDSNEKMLFCFDHEQYENIVIDLASSLAPLFKENGKST